MSIDLNALIKEVLQANNMSVRQLAKNINASYSTLNNALNGKSGMHVDTLLRIIEELELEIVGAGSEKSLDSLLKENTTLKEDNENLRTLTNFLKKENEELRTELKQIKEK